jgi:hypothetical protein
MRNPQPSLPGQPADLRSPLPAASATRPIRNVGRRMWFHTLAFAAVAAPLFIMDVVLHFPRPQDPRPPRLAPLVLSNPVRVVMRVQISSKPRTDLFAECGISRCPWSPVAALFSQLDLSRRRVQSFTPSINFLVPNAKTRNSPDYGAIDRCSLVFHDVASAAGQRSITHVVVFGG